MAFESPRTRRIIGGHLSFIAQPRRRRLRLIAVGATASLAVAATAFAEHWAQMGGDPGRSGYQPVEEVGPPISLEYTADEAGGVRTSMLTTGGADAGDQRMVYSTSDGR